MSNLITTSESENYSIQNSDVKDEQTNKIKLTEKENSKRKFEDNENDELLVNDELLERINNQIKVCKILTENDMITICEDKYIQNGLLQTDYSNLPDDLPETIETKLKSLSLERDRKLLYPFITEMWKTHFASDTYKHKDVKSLLEFIDIIASFVVDSEINSPNQIMNLRYVQINTENDQLNLLRKMFKPENKVDFVQQDALTVFKNFLDLSCFGYLSTVDSFNIESVNKRNKKDLVEFSFVLCDFLIVPTVVVNFEKSTNGNSFSTFTPAIEFGVKFIKRLLETCNFIQSGQKFEPTFDKVFICNYTKGMDTFSAKGSSSIKNNKNDVSVYYGVCRRFSIVIKQSDPTPRIILYLEKFKKSDVTYSLIYKHFDERK